MFNYVRFCYNNEPYDTIVLEHRAIIEIDTTLAIFEMITEEECFKTDISKITDDITQDEEAFFPDWFSIKSINCINKLILASFERSILIKYHFFKIKNQIDSKLLYQLLCQLLIHGKHEIYHTVILKVMKASLKNALILSERWFQYIQIGL